MSAINYTTKEIHFKIVYWGPGLSGKTTNIKEIYGKIKLDNKGKLVSLATETERTLFFDFFPLDLGTVKGYKVKFHIYTVPGQVYYYNSRAMLLKGVDGIIFVADSQRERFDANLENLSELLSSLKEFNIDFETLPYVLQLNKRDLPNITPAHELIYGLRRKNEPVVEAVALKGKGIVETLKSISKLILMDVKRKLGDDQPINVTESIKSESLSNNFDYLLDSQSRSQNIPVEISNKGVFAVSNYLESLDQKRKLHEAKLLIVGGGAVGKTSLMKRIIDKTFSDEDNATEGIEIKKWIIEIGQIKNFRVNFWDFGGQEIFHSTHQFFLTKRSLYLFVWDARKDDDLLNFDYWLNVIKLLSGESPIIIVLNKIDLNVKLIDEASLKNKFNNIVAFFKVSSKYGSGINELEHCIHENINGLPHVGDVLPEVWLDIRERLEGLNKNFIDYLQYKEICADFGLDEGKADFLSQYFHDLGVFLHFQDNPILKDILFLDPHWATNAVYKLVGTSQIREKGGRFNFKELKSIWRNFPENKYIHLLELLKRFELCFQLPNSENYIIPELLPPNKPEFNWEFKGNLRFEYHYEFMPAGIITRFIVRNNDLIENNIYWQNGVVLKRENTKALVIGEKLKRKVRVWLQGIDSKGLLEIIRRDFDYIHKSLNDPVATAMVPCICSKCQKSDEPNFFSFFVLKKYKEKEKNEIVCNESIESVSVDKLVSGIEKTQRFEDLFQNYGTNKPIFRAINIFVASSEWLKEERDRIELEISRKNSLLLSQGFYLELKIWEKASASFSLDRKQNEFNEMVLDSDIFICLIHDRIGKFTMEEFNIAYENFKKNKKPRKIYVYFKKIVMESMKMTEEFKSVLAFKEQILKYEQFYTDYNSLEDLLLKINKNLGMDLPQLKKEKSESGFFI